VTAMIDDGFTEIAVFVVAVLVVCWLLAEALA